MAKTVPVLLCFIFLLHFVFSALWTFVSFYSFFVVCLSILVNVKFVLLKMILFWKGRSVEEEGRKKEMHGDKKEKRKRWESEWSDKISVNWDVHGGLRGQYLQHPQPRNWTQPEHLAFNSKQIRKIKKRISLNKLWVCLTILEGEGRLTFITNSVTLVSASWLLDGCNLLSYLHFFSNSKNSFVAYSYIPYGIYID